MINYLIEMVGAVIGSALLYQLLLSDFVEEKYKKWKDNKNIGSSANKIAQIKIISDDIKGIEKFVTDNAQYLSDQTVKKLVGRIEEIKAGDVIAADDLLKVRINNLSIPDTVAAPVEDVESNGATKSKRARN